MPAPTPNRALAARRAFLDISQRRLGFATGLSENRMWRIENGYADPTPDERAVIARELDTTEAELFPPAPADDAASAEAAR